MPNDPAKPDKKITSLLDDYTQPDDIQNSNDDDDLADDVKEALGIQEESEKKEKVVSINSIVNDDYLSTDEQAALEEIDKVDSLV